MLLISRVRLRLSSQPLALVFVSRHQSAREVTCWSKCMFIRVCNAATTSAVPQGANGIGAEAHAAGDFRI